MSYTRRRGLAGVSSQPPGRPVILRSGASLPLGGVSSQPPGLPVATRSLSGLGSLGADESSITAPTLIDPAETRAYRQRMEKYQQDLIAAQRHWAEGDKFQKWVQIGATVSIPVFAAIWRLIGVGRKRRRLR